MKKRQKWRLLPPFLLPLPFLIIMITGGLCGEYPYFEDTNSLGFNHLAVHEYTEWVYVGGVNRIHQLSRDLRLEAEAIMGPHDDSPKCPVTRVCPNELKKPTDYYNKALVIDYSMSRVIACGSLFQGVCTVHGLNDVSDYDTPANESVVANNSTASTVAFMAHGPKALERTHVLYVGVSWTGNGPYRSDVPAVSSRSLDPKSMFVIAHTGVTTGTKVMVNTMSREIYPISYVFGFDHKGFSYLLTVQKEFMEQPTPFISKLVRVCQRDMFYYSYTEVQISCKSPEDDVHYNLAQAAHVNKPGSELAKSLGITAQDMVLFVVFAKSKDEAEIYNKPSANSALCVYALSAVHRKFTQNIQRCFNGIGVRGLGFINPSTDCYATQLQINDDFCGMDVNTPLGGSMAIEAAPVLRFSGILLTAVAASSTHDYTVTFLGTSTGHLKKAVVETVTKAAEYSDLAIVEGSPVNADMLFDKAKTHLYVMTKTRVTMVKVQECHVYTTCMECLGAYDPYCGWCSLENKCSLRGACAQAAKDPLYWLSYKSGKCTTITEVHPPQIQRTTARILNLVIDNLPVLEGHFLCAFNSFGKTLVTNASRTTNGVNCATPHTDTLPAIPPGQHHFTAILSVRMQTDKDYGPDFVATNFTFYDCSTYTSCTQCVSSDFPCDWCVTGHRCTHDTGENCRNDVLVTGVSSIGPSIRSGPGFCPRINKTSDGSTEILVASGVAKRITVKVDNIQVFGNNEQHIARMRFLCQFNIEGRVKQVNAQLIGEIMYCDEMVFAYTAAAPNTTAAFAVIWDVNKPFDNPENIRVLIFRCSRMAQSCGICLELAPKYNCGWCQETENSCQVYEHCDRLPTLWLDRHQTCPNPQILSFEPKSGPWEGGTNITITGINLGRVFDDIKGNVHVVHEDRELALCEPHPDLYVKTTKIVCRVEGPRNITTGTGLISGPITGYIEVKVLKDYTARSREQYSFVNPHIIEVKPTKGPRSGGTALEIWGLHMNAGSKAEAFVGGKSCNVTSRVANNVVCITSAAKDAERETVRIKFDNGLRVFEDYKFWYVDDPVITSVESGPTGPRGVPKGIPSGGVTIHVKGTNLNSVVQPYMYVIVNDQEYNSTCIVESEREMKCKSPRVDAQLTFPSDDNEIRPIELDYGFKMDNVETVKNLSSLPKFPKFLMYHDPIYYPFNEKNGIKYYKSDYLTINGLNLDRASQETDVMVRIGTSFCNVTSLSRSQLTCRPPTKQPPGRDAYGKPDKQQIPQVVVEVGDNLKFEIGHLSYVRPCDEDNA